MFILTTMDNNFPNVWEEGNEIATFNSKYEHGVTSLIQSLGRNKIYAIGVYRKYKEEAQNHDPSLLIINNAILLNTNRLHDIQINFTFLKKLPPTIDKYLYEIKPKVTPLIWYIRNNIFFNKLGIKSYEDI